MKCLLFVKILVKLSQIGLHEDIIVINQIYEESQIRVRENNQCTCTYFRHYWPPIARIVGRCVRCSLSVPILYTTLITLRGIQTLSTYIYITGIPGENSQRSALRTCVIYKVSQAEIWIQSLDHTLEIELIDLALNGRESALLYYY